MSVLPNVIAQVLTSNGFTQTDRKQKLMEFTSANGQDVVYVNRESKTGVRALRVHPMRTDLQNTGLAGVTCAPDFVHHSNMEKYPARVHKGEDPIPYALAFSFESMTACDQFVKRI